jgi:hypothetical protein
MATQSIGSFGSKLNLNIRQGGTFDATATAKNPDTTPINLTGATVRGQIRKKALDTAVVESFTCTITDAVNGVFTFGLTDEETAAIAAGEQPTEEASLYVWDMELEDSLGRVTPLFYGNVTVLREVTRP